MASADELRDWMRAAQAGDAQAYRALLTALQGWLTRAYRARLPAGQVDDLVQEVLFAVHSKRHTYDPGQPLLPWVAAIARYKWIDALRRLERKGEVDLPETLAATDNSEAGAHARNLQQLLDQLPDGQARAIRLTRIEGYSIEEASAMTGQSASLVKVNVHRGIKRLSLLIEAADQAMETGVDAPGG